MKKEEQINVWDGLDEVLHPSIESLGNIINITKSEWQCQYQLDNCYLYFSFQKYDNHIEVVIGDLSQEYGQDHRVVLSPALELYFTDELKNYIEYSNKGPEFITLLNGKKQPMGYIARMLESKELRALANNKFKKLPEFNRWYRRNAKSAIEKMKNALA
ncbi:MAG: hypothetical protein R2798_12045 [Chitinophagales bacterium]|nr:hypothetical protein [Chitinophagales bacterium]